MFHILVPASFSGRLILRRKKNNKGVESGFVLVSSQAGFATLKLLEPMIHCRIMISSQSTVWYTMSSLVRCIPAATSVPEPVLFLVGSGSGLLKSRRL